MLSKAGGWGGGKGGGKLGERLGESHETSNVSFSRRKKIENALMCGRVKRESFENADGIFKNCFPVENH